MKILLHVPFRIVLELFLSYFPRNDYFWECLYELCIVSLELSVDYHVSKELENSK